MPGCLGCPTSSSTTISGVWTDLRSHYGPHPDSLGSVIEGEVYRDTLYNEDLSYYSEWAIEHGIPNPLNDSNYGTFKRWFIWKLMFGSNSGGNLPIRNRDHIGLLCAPCPYSTNCDDIRATHMVGSVPSNQNDHEIYYMRITSRGNVWGFECTYSGCQYLIDTGNKYFYV